MGESSRMPRPLPYCRQDPSLLRDFQVRRGRSIPSTREQREQPPTALIAVHRSMLVDLFVVPLVVFTTNVERKVDVEEEIHLQQGQLLGRNASHAGIVRVRVKIIIERLRRDHNAMGQTGAARLTSLAVLDERSGCSPEYRSSE